jgi:hypothetical protein
MPINFSSAAERNKNARVRASEEILAWDLFCPWTDIFVF